MGYSIERTSCPLEVLNPFKKLKTIIYLFIRIYSPPEHLYKHLIGFKFERDLSTCSNYYGFHKFSSVETGLNNSRPTEQSVSLMYFWTVRLLPHPFHIHWRIWQISLCHWNTFSYNEKSNFKGYLRNQYQIHIEKMVKFSN